MTAVFSIGDVKKVVIYTQFIKPAFKTNSPSYWMRSYSTNTIYISYQWRLQIIEVIDKNNIKVTQLPMTTQSEVALYCLYKSMQ